MALVCSAREGAWPSASVGAHIGKRPRLGTKAGPSGSTCKLVTLAGLILVKFQSEKKPGGASLPGAARPGTIIAFERGGEFVSSLPGCERLAAAPFVMSTAERTQKTRTSPTC